MLYLRPPYHVINGTTVFPDHADPRQFYYLPAVPRVARRAPAGSAAEVPQVQLLRYRGESRSGGFLNLDVHLGLTEEEVETVRSELMRREDLDETPRLAPVPLVDGSVRIMLFGASTEASPAGDEDASDGGDAESGPSEGGGTEPAFVTRIDQHARPALYGQNQAAFSVSLGTAGVTALEEALKGEMSPIGIVYSLDYLALRPAYTVQVHADWKRVYDHLHRHFDAETVLGSAEIDKQVDKLIEDRAIEIEVDTLVTEEAASEGLMKRRDQAVTELREMVTDAFFEPSLEPPDRSEGADPGAWQKATGALKRVVAMGATGGLSALGSFQLKKVDYQRIDKKRLDVSMRERTTVRRSIHPQGHLAGLFQGLRDEGFEMDRFVRSVTLGDPWFERRTVEVISRSDFEGDAIESIQVNLDYEGETKDLVLEASDDRKTVDWPSQMKDGDRVDAVEYTYTVRFAEEGGVGRPVTLTSGKRVEKGQKAEIDARELYAIEEVPIIALDFPWDEYSHVRVDLRYEDSENDLRHRDSLLLSEKNTEATWRLFLLDPERRSFQYRLTYRARDHDDEVRAWQTARSGRITIRDPFPEERVLTVVAAFPWENVKNVFVDLRYHDPANEVREEESLTFTGENPSPKTFRVSLSDPDRRRVDYQATIVYEDGRIDKIPASNTRERRIILTPETRGHRLVQLHPANGSFEEENLEAMEVTIRSETAEHAGSADGEGEAGSNGSNGDGAAETFRFESADEAARFEYAFDAGDEAYRYRVDYRFADGLSKSTEWTAADADDLAIPIASRQ